MTSTTIPTAAQVKAGEDQGGTTTNAQTQACVAATPVDITISGLSVSTAYTVWCVAEDAVPNLMADGEVKPTAGVAVTTAAGARIAQG